MGRSNLSTARLILVIALLILTVYGKYEEAHASRQPAVITAATTH